MHCHINTAKQYIPLQVLLLMVQVTQNLGVRSAHVAIAIFLHNRFANRSAELLTKVVKLHTMHCSKGTHMDDRDGVINRFCPSVASTDCVHSFKTRDIRSFNCTSSVRYCSTNKLKPRFQDDSY